MKERQTEEAQWKDSDRSRKEWMDSAGRGSKDRWQKKSICPCVLGGQGRFYFMFSLAYETMTLSLSTWLAPGQGLPYQGPCF